MGQSERSILLTLDSELGVGGHAHAVLRLGETSIASGVALGRVFDVETGNVAPRVHRLGLSDKRMATPDTLKHE